MTEYILPPHDCARNMRRETRGHIWGLHALIYEAFRVLKTVSSDKEERAQYMHAFFLAKIPVHRLPPKKHQLGRTLEGQMLDHIYRLIESPTFAADATKARIQMQALISSRSKKEVDAKSDYIDFAMHVYEEAFGAARSQRVQFLEGCYGTKK